MRMNLAQRITLVVATGLALFTVGEWIIESSYPGPHRVATYITSPLSWSSLTPAQTFLMWLGFIIAWTVISLAILRTPRSSRKERRSGSPSGDAPL